MSINEYSYKLLEFQSIFATSVGIGLAFPVLIDVFSRSDERLKTSCTTRLKTLKNQDDQSNFKNLGLRLNEFKRHRNASIKEMQKVSLYMFFLAFLNLLLLMISVFFGKSSIQLLYAIVIVLVSLIPVALGFYYSQKWYFHQKKLLFVYNETRMK